MQWKLPDLGEGVQEGEIVQWLVKEGDTISVDQPLLEIMTDKATMEIPSSVEGLLQKLYVKEGDIAKIGQVLADIGESKEEENLAPPKMESREVKEISTPNVTPSTMRHSLLASPSVRRRAREKGIDLNQFSGSGPEGRLLISDLEGGQKPVIGNQTVAQTSPISGGPEERQPLRGLRRKIAEHMVLSRRTAAHFSHFDEIDLTDLVELRKKQKTEAEKWGIKLTFLAYFVKAAAKALQKFPSVNASLDDNTQEIVLKKYFNIGIAVATPNGLIVPNIKNADQLSLFEIAKEITRLGEAARNNKIELGDLKHGTFTLTNIGSIGGILSVPIVNYPEAAIVGVHKTKPSVEVVDGEFAVRQMMQISLSGDHRVIDGADAARFINEMKRSLENPNEFV